MIQITIVNKKTSSLVDKHILENLDDLFEFLADVKTHSLRRNDYYVNFTSENIHFFEKTYTPDFFTTDIRNKRIKLNVLPHGVRRVLSFSKTTDNERLFAELRARVEKELTEQIGEINGTLALTHNTHYLDENIKIIVISFKFNKEVEGVDDTFHQCVIEFNTITWEYNIVSLKSKRFRMIYEKVNKVFNNRTYSTMLFRKHRHENNFK